MRDPKTIAILLAVAVLLYGAGRIHGYHDGYDGRGAEVRLAQARQESAELETLQIRAIMDLANAGALDGFQRVTPIPVAAPVGACSSVAR